MFHQKSRYKKTQAGYWQDQVLNFLSEFYYDCLFTKDLDERGQRWKWRCTPFLAINPRTRVPPEWPVGKRILEKVEEAVYWEVFGEWSSFDEDGQMEVSQGMSPGDYTDTGEYLPFLLEEVDRAQVRWNTYHKALKAEYEDTAALAASRLPKKKLAKV